VGSWANPMPQSLRRRSSRNTAPNSPCPLCSDLRALCVKLFPFFLRIQGHPRVACPHRRHRTICLRVIPCRPFALGGVLPIAQPLTAFEPQKNCDKPFAYGIFIL
jgi:hypothetical protein